MRDFRRAANAATKRAGVGDPGHKLGRFRTNLDK